MAVNVAVIGLGKMGISHLAIANALSQLNVTAICDTSEIVGNVLQKYTKLPFISDFDKLLDQPGLEAVIVATPTTTHDWMARKAIDKGLHVFCEKPLTLSSAVSRELAASAEAKGLVTQVGYHNRFIGTFREVKKLLDAGAIGKVSHVQGEAYGPVVLKPAKPTWRGKAGAGGGCLYDYAAHPLNLLNWYFGEPEACSGAMLKSGFSTEVDDEVYAALGFANGVTGQISVNWSDPSVRKMTTRITIWGTAGRIYADRQEIQVFLTGNAPIPEGYKEGWTVNYITDLTPPVSFYLRGEEYSAQLEAFGDAIAEGKGSRENSFFSSAETDATIEMIRASAAGSGSVGSFGATELVPRKAGLVGRILGR
ncbi:Gfo/Idh/MocA family protein [Novosphingobium soli]|uniref:Gfo/Idh/MocA family protein n=1 Tax=Novosphingobium soli TaxID=574956 RepID=A0ABV6CWX0_9SPHN